MRPRLLDCFCKAGGAAMGFHRAGFEVVGIDIAPQPNYPFEFIQGDAMDLLQALLTGFRIGGCDEISGYWLCDFAAIHASPPCQAYSSLKSFTTKDFQALVPQVRSLLRQTGLPYVIENVMGAPLISPVRLCGSSFGLRVWRHRLFETNFPIGLVPPCSHREFTEPLDVTGTGGPSKKPRTKPGGGLSRKPVSLSQAQQAMGIDWMKRSELAEAIPPAFTEYIGQYLMAEVRAQQEAAA